MEVIRRDGPARNLAKLRERLWYVWHGLARFCTCSSSRQERSRTAGLYVAPEQTHLSSASDCYPPACNVNTCLDHTCREQCHEHCMRVPALAQLTKQRGHAHLPSHPFSTEEDSCSTHPHRPGGRPGSSACQRLHAGQRAERALLLGQHRVGLLHLRAGSRRAAQRQRLKAKHSGSAHWCMMGDPGSTRRAF